MVSKPEVLSNILQTLRIKRLEIEQTTTKLTANVSHKTTCLN